MLPKGNSPQCYGQGGRLFRSNLGVNIPIMQVISNDGTTDMTVSEFAGFTSSILPDNITTGYHDGFRRRGGWSEADATDATHDWASPVGDRFYRDLRCITGIRSCQRLRLWSDGTWLKLHSHHCRKMVQPC